MLSSPTGDFTMSRSIALTGGATKEAALYFDDVVPLMPSLDMLLDVLSRTEGRASLQAENNWAPWQPALYDSLLPSHLAQSSEFRERLKQLNVASSDFFLAAAAKFVRDKKIDVGDDMRPLAKKFKPFSSKYRLLSDSLLSDFDLRRKDIIYVAGHTNAPEHGGDDVCITLQNLDLIDSSSLSWEALAEIRKDPDALARLRRLRAFVSENYKDKTLSFVKDDLEARLFDYHHEVKKWGFETKISAVSLLLDSKSLQAFGAATFIAAVFGAPVAAVVAAVGGATIELGKMGVEVAKKRHSMREALRTNPVSYIGEIRRGATPRPSR
jgi:hypothetical protein